MPKPSAFSLIYHTDDTAILLDSIQNFRVADFCCPADLPHLSPYPQFNTYYFSYFQEFFFEGYGLTWTNSSQISQSDVMVAVAVFEFDNANGCMI